jgi:hypothetical protein
MISAQNFGNGIFLVGPQTYIDQFLHAFDQQSNTWEIDTKYYNATAYFTSTKSDLSVEAVIYLYKSSDSDLIESFQSFTHNLDIDPSIKISVSLSTNEEDSMTTLVNDHETLFWNLGYEHVNWLLYDNPLSNTQLSRPFEATEGIKRVKEILESHIWPGMIMKNKKLSNTFREEYEEIDIVSSPDPDQIIKLNDHNSLNEYVKKMENDYENVNDNELNNVDTINDSEYNFQDIKQLHENLFGSLDEEGGFEKVLLKLKDIKGTVITINVLDMADSAKSDYVRRILAEKVALAFSFDDESDEDLVGHA